MSEIELDVKAVGNIIKIAMANNDMCKSCELVVSVSLHIHV